MKSEFKLSGVSVMLVYLYNPKSGLVAIKMSIVQPAANRRYFREISSKPIKSSVLIRFRFLDIPLDFREQMNGRDKKKIGVGVVLW